MLLNETRGTFAHWLVLTDFGDPSAERTSSAADSAMPNGNNAGIRDESTRQPR
jgi:hypothetical protein